MDRIMDPRDAARRIAELEGQIGSLERRERELSAQTSEQGAALSTKDEQISDRNEMIENLNAELRRLSAQVGELRAQLAGRDSTVSNLRTRIEVLQGRIDELTPDEVTQRQIEAARLIAKEDAQIAKATEAKARWKSIWQAIGGGLVAAAITAIVFGFVAMLGTTATWLVWAGTSGLVGALVALLPVIRKCIVWVGPYAKQYWRAVCVVGSLVIGGTTASLGLSDTNTSGWATFLTWTGVTIGFAVALQTICEAVSFLYRRMDDPSVAKWKLHGTIAALASMIFGLVTAIIATKPLVSIVEFKGSSPALFLFNWLVASLGFIASSGIAALLAWVVMKLIGKFGINFFADTVANFRVAMTEAIAHAKEQDGRRRWPKVALVGLSGLVSTLMIMTLYPVTNGSYVNKGLALGFGLMLGICYLIVESLAMDSLANPKTGQKKAQRMTRWAVLFACLSVFLSFGKIYSLSSYNERVADVKADMESKAKAYLSAVEAKAIKKANNADTEDVAQKYKGAVEDMKRAIGAIGQAGSYEEIKVATDSFVSAGNLVTDCLPITADKDLLKVVAAPSEPGHTALAIQIVHRKPIPGAPEVKWGDVFFALSATAFVDFAAVLLSLALRAWYRREEDDEDEEQPPKSEAAPPPVA